MRSIGTFDYQGPSGINHAPAVRPVCLCHAGQGLLDCQVGAGGVDDFWAGPGRATWLKQHALICCFVFGWLGF